MRPAPRRHAFPWLLVVAGLGCSGAGVPTGTTSPIDAAPSGPPSADAPVGERPAPGLPGPDGALRPDAVLAPPPPALPDPLAACAQPLDPEPKAICGAAKCGNNTLDTCSEPCGGPPGSNAPCPQFYEECDGTVQVPATCAGFVAGTPRCSAVCTLDTSGCTSCETDPHVVACRPLELPARRPRSLATTVGRGEIAAVWISNDAAMNRYPARVQFARLRPDLTVIGSPSCVGSDFGHLTGPYSLSVAATATGWMVAVWDTVAVRVVALDVAGKMLGPPRALPGAHLSALVGSPRGSLFAYYVFPTETTYELRVALLRDDGTEVWQKLLLSGARMGATSGAVFTGESFLVAASIGGPVVVTTIGIDGSIGEMRRPLPQVDTLFLVPDERGARIVTWTRTREVTSAQLDKTGNMVGTPAQVKGLTIGVGNGGFWIGAVTALPGGDTVLATVEQEGLLQWMRVRIARLGPEGALRSVPFPLARDPRYPAGLRLAAVGNETVALWLDSTQPGRITGARLTPP